MSRENDIDILARTIYGEARGENYLGKKAVASVIINRYKRKTWFSGETIAATCQFAVEGSKFHQFSCWNTWDKNYKIIKSVAPADMKEEVEIATGYVDGTLRDVVAGCCHYHVKGANPKWARGCVPDFEIGNHLFYSKVR